MVLRRLSIRRNFHLSRARRLNKQAKKLSPHERKSLSATTPPSEENAFRKPGDAATLPELIKFLIDRSGYIKVLEDEATPESQSRIENLRELVNAAQDADERGETLTEFLDHAALVSDTDKYDPESRVTLMTLHAAKGLEFPLVFLAGMEEGLFPHSRTINDGEGLEEERRLCYVGMTRAMDALLVTRARFRRRYGNDSPEFSTRRRASLSEIPGHLIEDLSAPVPANTWGGYAAQSTRPTRIAPPATPTAISIGAMKTKISVRRTQRPSPTARKESPPAAKREVRSTTSHSFLPPAVRSSRDRKSLLPSLPEKPVFAAANAFDTRNMEREWFSNAKVKGKTQRLRYNFLGSALKNLWRSSPSWSESETSPDSIFIRINN